MKLTHPASAQVIEVEPDHAGPYLSQGWVEAAKPKRSRRQQSEDPDES